MKSYNIGTIPTYKLNLEKDRDVVCPYKINNKTVYRRGFCIPTMSISNNFHLIAILDDLNIDSIVKVSGGGTYGRWKFSFPYRYSGTEYVYFGIRSNSFGIIASRNYSNVYCYIEYTKKEV